MRPRPPYVAERIGLLGGSKAVESYGIDRVVFATDYPIYDMSAVRQQVEDTVGPQAARQIYANRVPGLRLPTPAARS